MEFCLFFVIKLQVNDRCANESNREPSDYDQLKLTDEMILKEKLIYSSGTSMSPASILSITS